MATDHTSCGYTHEKEGTGNTYNGDLTFKFMHRNPSIKTTLTFNSALTKFKLNFKGVNWSTSTKYGYNFVFFKSKCSSVDFSNITGNDGYLWHVDRTGAMSTSPDVTSGWFNVSDCLATTSTGNVYLNLYAKCQASECGTDEDPGTTKNLPYLGTSEKSEAVRIFHILMYVSPKNLEAVQVSQSGTKVKAQFNFTASKSHEPSQVYMELLDSSGNYLDQYDFDTTATSGVTHQFTGLSKGTVYYVRCGINDEYGTYQTSKIKFRTYDTTIDSNITTTATSATIPNITLGYENIPNITAPTQIKYEVYPETGSTVIASGTLSLSSGKTGSFDVTGLDPATTYRIGAWPVGATDAKATERTFTTKDAPGGLSISVYDTTGETITLQATWSGGTDETVSVSIKLNGVTKTVTTKGGTVQFTGLSHNTTYDYSATGTGSESGTFGTVSGSAKTYGASISVSTRSAKSFWIDSFGYSNGTGGSSPSYMYYEIYDYDYNLVKSQTYDSISSINIVIDGLSINSTYRIKYWLDYPTDTVEWATAYTGSLLSGLSLTATASTGTTITIKASWNWNYEWSGTCTVTLNGESKTVSNNGSVKFTGLTRGTTYTASGEVVGSEGGYSSASCDGKTYDINIDWVETKTTSQTVKFSIIEGNSGNKDSSIRFKIKKSSDSSWGSEQTGSTSNTVISGLTSDTSYDIQYYITGVIDENGNLDVVKTDTFTTLGAVAGLKFEATDITGTTATIKVTWNESGSTGIVATVTLNGVSKTVSTKGGTVQFTGLTNGTAYTVSGSAKDNEGNTTTAPNISVTTYKVGITIEDTSTRAGKYKLEIIAGPDTSLTIDYTCQQSSTTDSPLTAASGDSKITDGLWQHTTYIVTAWIDNMKDENGNIDTKVTVSFTTKALTVQCTSSSYTQHTITTHWQAYADGAEYDKCQLTDNAITFNISKCNNTPKATTGYQTTTINGSVSGSYKILESAGLCYYAYYTIECTVSDGKNESSSTVDVHTDFPYSYVNDGSGFKKVVPYVYTGGKWQKAPVFVNNGAWRESNGE